MESLPPDQRFVCGSWSGAFTEVKLCRLRYWDTPIWTYTGTLEKYSDGELSAGLSLLQLVNGDITYRRHAKLCS